MNQKFIPSKKLKMNFWKFKKYLKINIFILNKEIKDNIVKKLKIKN
jgi:hypothetical protein